MIVTHYKKPLFIDNIFITKQFINLYKIFYNPKHFSNKKIKFPIPETCSAGLH